MSDHPARVRVLIADDDAHNRQLLGEVCASEGYEVDSVEDGHAALTMAQTVRFDLVLLDASMPGMSGYEVLAEIRADVRTAKLPVIMVTANPQEDARLRAQELGVSGYVEKPFRLFDLTQRMRLAMRRPRGDGEPSTLPRLRVRRALGDVLPHLPSPSELRPAMRRTIDEAWAAGTELGCAVLRFEAGPTVLRTQGRTARDAALGALIVHLGGAVMGPVHRGDDDELVFLVPPAFCDLLPGLLRELATVATETLEQLPEGPPLSLGVVLLPPRSARPDVDAVLRIARAVAGRATAARPPVLVEVFAAAER